MLAARRFALAARPGAAARAIQQRWRSSVVLLKDLPFALNTEDLLRGALEETLAGAPAPASLALKSRSSGRFNGRAQLVFADEAAAAAAFAVLRSAGAKIGDRGVSCAWGVAPYAPLPPLSDEEKREDPLAEILRVVEERQLPSLETIRRDLMENDQYGILRSKKLPGLTWPEDLEGGPAPRAPEPKPEPAGPEGRWAETIVKIDRVQKVVRGGTIMRYRALVAVGNLMGAGGFAFGKGHSPQDAVARASRRAKADLRFVDRHRDVALAHDVRGKHNNCTVDIYAVPPGKGMVGGALGRAIMTQLGFSSFTIKARGRRSPYSYVAATFDALANLASVEDIARKRGRRILEIEHALDRGRRY